MAKGLEQLFVDPKCLRNCAILNRPLAMARCYGTITKLLMLFVAI